MWLDLDVFCGMVFACSYLVYVMYLPRQDSWKEMMRVPFHSFSTRWFGVLIISLWLTDWLTVTIPTLGQDGDVLTYKREILSSSRKSV
jgi:hypothetical protein